MSDDLHETFKHLLDVLSIGVVFATLVAWLPNIAALLTVIWLAVRAYNEIMTAVDRGRVRALHRSLRSAVGELSED